ncbi:hypothetical protein EC988_005975, partial [Linderina pennispora]
MDIDARFITSGTCALTAMCPQLQSLRITNIDDGFPWPLFALSAASHAEFPDLHSLTLKFAASRQPPRDSLPSHHMHTFPALRRLLVTNAYEHSTNPYLAFLYSPLTYLVVQEHAETFQGIDVRLLHNIHHLSITISGNAWKPVAAYTES